jgi:hypothetical protein
MNPSDNAGWAFSPLETYTAFGDASVMAQGALYGIVLIPRSAVSEVEYSIASVKDTYRASSTTVIHCRGLFHPVARSKGPWANLNDQETIFLARDVFRAVNKYCQKYMVAFSPLEFFQKTLRLLGKKWTWRSNS